MSLKLVIGFCIVYVTGIEHPSFTKVYVDAPGIGGPLILYVVIIKNSLKRKGSWELFCVSEALALEGIYEETVVEESIHDGVEACVMASVWL